ncbi:hypothetical protein [Paenibacillus pectinilyticus]|uniref:hypothetical protein n=1 Tax=Paenibacillus pectinilyticus TaxID=512399 RepID=UPI00114CBFED|nr:hypothetical protein [Paenibacillus pectinilyticus]
MGSGSEPFGAGGTRLGSGSSLSRRRAELRLGFRAYRGRGTSFSSGSEPFGLAGRASTAQVPRLSGRRDTSLGSGSEPIGLAG